VASKHEIIVQALQTDFSVHRRGRLYKMMQGTFRDMHSDKVIRISPYPKKRDGFPDLFGFEYAPFCGVKIPVYCLIEVKTIAYPKLSQGQIDHLNYCVQIGGRAYVAREYCDSYELTAWSIT
jgi:hypothetical protein